MSAYEEAKARILPILDELNQCEDSEEEAHDWAHKLDLLLQAADKEIATKDAELARLREALDNAEDRLGIGLTEDNLIQAMHDAMAIISEALKSHDS